MGHGIRITLKVQNLCSFCPFRRVIMVAWKFKANLIFKSAKAKAEALFSYSQNKEAIMCRNSQTVSENA